MVGLFSFLLLIVSLTELVGQGDGIAILEQGLSFGGGTLASFGINSNTSANGFIKCLYKRREITNNLVSNGQKINNHGAQSAGVSPVKPGIGTNAMSPERKKLKDIVECGLEEGGDSDEEEDFNNAHKYEYIALNAFKDLYKHSPIIQMAFDFGPACIPLSAMGMILNFTGNHLLHYIHAVLKRKVFFPLTKVTSIQLLANGEIMTTAIRKECSIKLLAPGSGTNDTNRNGYLLI